MKPIQAYYFTINLARAVEALGVKVTSISGRLIGDEELQSLDNNGQYNIPEPMWQTIIFHTKTDEQMQVIKGLERSLRRMDICFDSGGVDERSWDLDWGFSYDRLRYESPCMPTMEDPLGVPAIPTMEEPLVITTRDAEAPVGSTVDLSRYLMQGNWEASAVTEVPTIQSEEAVRTLRSEEAVRTLRQEVNFSTLQDMVRPPRGAVADLPLGFRLEESEANNFQLTEEIAPELLAVLQEIDDVADIAEAQGD